MERTDEVIRKTSGADQRIHLQTDLIGPLHWFPVATDRFARLSGKVSRGLHGLQIETQADLKKGEHVQVYPLAGFV